MSPADAIVVEIVIQSRPDRVFDAFADPQQRLKWWVAEGQFRATHMESDLRIGGAWRMKGIGAEGKPFAISGEYRAVDRPHLLEFTWIPDWPEPPTLIRLELTEQGGATMVRLTHSGFADRAVRERYQGWGWILALLRGFLSPGTSGGEP